MYSSQNHLTNGATLLPDSEKTSTQNALQHEIYVGKY